MTKYRIMVEGEDGMLFCTKNDVLESDVDDLIEEAKEDYPCGHVWTEKEISPFARDGYYDWDFA